MGIINTDIAVIGAGPCGIFTVFELGLLGIRAHVIDSLAAIGGQCTTLYPDKPIYDIPGIPTVSGQELIDRLSEQAKPFEAVYHLGQQVTNLEQQEDKSFVLTTESNTQFHVRAIVIAAGLGAFRARPLRLSGVEQFVKTNLHYFVEDKSHFKDKNVVILGGGDSAIDWVLAFSSIAKSVTLVHRRQEFRAAPSSVSQMKTLAEDPNQNVRYIVGRIADYTNSSGKIDTINVLPFGNADETGELIELDELLVFYGLTPDLGPIADWGLNLDKKNIAVTPETCATNVPGIFAIGDINSYPGKKKLILAGFHEAALAAYAVQKYLDPSIKQRVQYTTTSSLLQERLGVTEPTE